VGGLSAIRLLFVLPDHHIDMKSNALLFGKRALLWGLVLVCLPPASVLAADNLIVPGGRVGKVFVGESSDDVHKDLGRPDSSDFAMSHGLETWISAANGVTNQLEIYSVRDFSRQGEPLTVKHIRVTSPAFSTSNGISTGSTLSEIQSSFKGARAVAYYMSGDGGRVYVYDDVKHGIAFEVARGKGNLSATKSRCVAIVVHARGEKSVNEYLPFHPELKRM